MAQVPLDIISKLPWVVDVVVVFVVELVDVANVHAHPVLAIQSAWLRRFAQAQA